MYHYALVPVSQQAMGRQGRKGRIREAFTFF
jgi:hypothetical protein